MKFYIFCKGAFFLLMLFCFQISFGQNNYEIIYLNFSDSIRPDYRQVETKYYTAKASLSYSLPYNLSTGVHNLPTGDNTVKQIKVTELNQTKKYLYKDYSKNQVFQECHDEMFFPKKKVYSDSLNSFDWVLIGETKKINGYSCNKAITKWRGRSYTAWYTPEIAISEGPWKYGGLPGLIMEIYDEKKYVYWVIKTIKACEKVPITIPSKIDGNFADYRIAVKKRAILLFKSEASDGGVENADCKSCSTKSEIKIETIENLLEEF